MSSTDLRIGVLGINFKTAELILREAIAKGAQSLAGERRLFFPHPTVLLSTCNRTEIYFSAPDLAQAQSDLLALLRTQIEDAFEHRLYSYFGIDCFAHLARVASGLDSAIFAESDIQRQVRIAYSEAAACLALPSCLHFLFQKSLKVSKSIRSSFHFEKGAPSLFGTLWQLAQQELGDLKQKRVLLVGYSEIHRGFASFLTHRNASDLTFCTRSPHSVEEGKAVGREELERWSDYDLISCASHTDEFLIRGKGRGKHLIFDLSVPRNVDPSVEAVTLFNIEQIDRIIEQKRTLQTDFCDALEERLSENVFSLSRVYREKRDHFVACQNAIR